MSIYQLRRYLNCSHQAGFGLWRTYPIVTVSLGCRCVNLRRTPTKGFSKRARPTVVQSVTRMLPTIAFAQPQFCKQPKILSTAFPVRILIACRKCSIRRSPIERFQKSTPSSEIGWRISAAVQSRCADTGLHAHNASSLLSECLRRPADDNQY